MSILAALLSFIITSCNMFNNKVPYKYFFSEKEYPIIEAIHKQDKEKLLEMMHQGWNVNSTGKYGMTYLLYAVWEHNYEMTRFLLENGADPNLVSPLTSTPDIIERRLPLEVSCYDDYSIDYVKLLIEHGAKVNSPDYGLPIFAAALNNDRKKIEYLLEHGADINQFNSSKETVITKQSIVSKWDMVLWLWDKGADPMKTGGIGVFEGEANVAFWVQDAIDLGNDENKRIKEVIARLKSIGVKFPYKPAHDGVEMKE